MAGSGFAMRALRHIPALFLGAGLLASGAVAQTEDTAVFGDWEKRCIARAEGGQECRLIQINKNAANGNVVMRSELAVSGEGNLVVLFGVPLSISLNEGPWLTVDGVYVAELSYERCTASGCNAIGVFGRFETTFLLKGKRAVVTLQPQNGVRVGIPVSLDGLPEAYGALLSAAH